MALVCFVLAACASPVGEDVGAPSSRPRPAGTAGGDSGFEEVPPEGEEGGAGGGEASAGGKAGNQVAGGKAGATTGKGGTGGKAGASAGGKAGSQAAGGKATGGQPAEEGGAGGEPAEEGGAGGEPAEEGGAGGEPAEEGGAGGAPTGGKGGSASGGAPAGGAGGKASAGAGGAPVENDCPRVRVSVEPTSSVNVRPDASTSKTPVGKLYNGNIVTCVAKVQGQAIEGNTLWYQIQSTAVSGFISGTLADCTKDQ